MQIHPKEQVRAAFARAMQLQPCREAAALAVAQAMGLCAEVVLQVVGEVSA